MIATYRYLLHRLWKNTKTDKLRDLRRLERLRQSGEKLQLCDTTVVLL